MSASTRRAIQLVPVVGDASDYAHMCSNSIRQGEKAIFLFDDNFFDRNVVEPGIGAAAIRPLGFRAVGIPVGWWSGSGGFRELDKDVRTAIHCAFERLNHVLHARPDIKKVYYPSSTEDPDCFDFSRSHPGKGVQRYLKRLLWSISVGLVERCGVAADIIDSTERDLEIRVRGHFHNNLPLLSPLEDPDVLFCVLDSLKLGSINAMARVSKATRKQSVPLILKLRKELRSLRAPFSNIRRLRHMNEEEEEEVEDEEDENEVQNEEKEVENILSLTSFTGRNLGDGGMQAFASVAIARGAMASLRYLTLSHNRIGGAGMTAFAGAIGTSGALASLIFLDLSHNQISDAGMISLTEAIGKGALGSLEDLCLMANQISDDGMRSLTEAIGKRTLDNLDVLNFTENQISDEGMKAFSTAIGSGALPKLEELYLGNNHFGDGGVSALASACASGALPSLRMFHLSDNNQIGDAGAGALASACASGALPSLEMLFVDYENAQLQAACEARRIILANGDEV